MKTIVLFILLLPASLFAQVDISGVIKDIDTKEPVACATVYLWYGETDLETQTAFDGSFTLSGVDDGEYYIEIYKEGYRSDGVDVSVEGEALNLEIEIYENYSESFVIEDIADFDTYDLGYGIRFFSPKLAETDTSFSSNISIDTYFLDTRFKLANRMQMGFKISPLVLQWTRFSDPATGIAKERYFGASASLFVYIRAITTVVKPLNSRGMFIDLGAGYTIPYYYAHSTISEANKYERSTVRHINRLNDIEAMMRIGFAWGAIKANYRFTDMLKVPYVQTPKLALGVEILIPMNN
jgi:hypothetical protein